MSQCPFCGSPVATDIVTYGGTCPKCFAEIPGEDAPTDPGADVRAAQERRDRARAAIPAMVGLAALFAVMTCTGIVAVSFALWPDPQVADLLDFDELTFPMPEVVEAAKVAAPSPGPGPQPRPSTSAPSIEDRVAQLSGNGVSSGGGASASDLGSNGTASTGPGLRGTQMGEDPAAPDLSIGGPSQTSQAGAIDLSIGGGREVRRDQNLVLDDPVAIRDMIGEEMSKGIASLGYCYERRLKEVPTLQGKWRITYKVSVDGTAVEPGARGIDRSDAELEKCLEKQVSNWTFGRISKATPVAKTLTFRPR